MSGTKEIRMKIRSIKNTQKITRAMEMVAASKMRKAQDRMAASKPYVTHIVDVIGHLAKGHPEYHSMFLDEREPKRVGYIVVSTDRGLCGGLNINLFKKTIKSMEEWSNKNVDIDMCLIGTKGETFFKNMGANIVSATGHLGDNPSLADLIGSVKIMLDAYLEQKIDRLYIVYNDFINTMTQTPLVHQMLPPPPSEQPELDKYWDYLYEPDAKTLIDGMLQRFIEAQVYQAVIENIACEQAARMVAMKSASDNAGDLIEDLQLVYNKARQAAITQELSEIIGGAAAV